MKTKWIIVVIVVAILVTVGVLSSAAGDKPEELDEYGSVEIALVLFFITSPLWAPLALALLLLPRSR